MANGADLPPISRQSPADLPPTHRQVALDAIACEHAHVLGQKQVVWCYPEAKVVSRNAPA